MARINEITIRQVEYDADGRMVVTGGILIKNRNLVILFNGLQSSIFKVVGGSLSLLGKYGESDELTVMTDVLNGDRRVDSTKAFSKLQECRDVILEAIEKEPVYVGLSFEDIKCWLELKNGNEDKYIELNVWQTNDRYLAVEKDGQGYLLVEQDVFRIPDIDKYNSDISVAFNRSSDKCCVYNHVENTVILVTNAKLELVPCCRLDNYNNSIDSGYVIAKRCGKGITQIFDLNEKFIGEFKVKANWTITNVIVWDNNVVMVMDIGEHPRMRLWRPKKFTGELTDIKLVAKGAVDQNDTVEGRLDKSEIYKNYGKVTKTETDVVERSNNDNELGETDSSEEVGDDHIEEVRVITDDETVDEKVEIM